MTRDVVISIKGLHFQMQENEELEVISSGKYYERNGKRYVVYEEAAEDENGRGETVKCMIKFNEDYAELIKRGFVDVHMLFEKGHKNLTYYNTPVGQMLIGIDTTKITILEGKDIIQLLLTYSLEINYSYVAECTVDIRIAAK